MSPSNSRRGKIESSEERSIDDDVTIITGNPVAIRELSVLVDRTRRRVSVAGDKSLPAGTALPDVTTKQLDVYSSRFQSIDCPALLFFSWPVACIRATQSLFFFSTPVNRDGCGASEYGSLRCLVWLRRQLNQACFCFSYPASLFSSGTR